MENKKKMRFFQKIYHHETTTDKKKGVILNRVDKKLKKDHQVERTIKPAA